MSPGREPVDSLSAGEVGYVITGLKDVSRLRVGETLTSRTSPATEPLPGYQDVKPMVFAGIFPSDSDTYPELRDALERLKLNDASLSYEPETSQALGFGFRCGFLGLLHMEIVRERLEREFDLALISTAPSVEYLVHTTKGEVVEVDNPSDMPPAAEVDRIEEPWLTASIITPTAYTGTLIELCESRRGSQQRIDYLSPERVEIVYRVPLAEVVTDFFDQLKSRSQGYASLDYEPAGYRQTPLVKVDLLLNGVPADEQEYPPGKPGLPPPVRRVYDITRFVREGPNVINFGLTSPSGPPTLLADFEVEGDFSRLRVGTDSGWLGRPGDPTDPVLPAPAGRGVWRPCVMAPEASPPAWLPRREVVVAIPPARVITGDAAGQFGLTMHDITRSLVTATSSTRFTDKNLWIDPKSGLVFQTQVQIPEGIMSEERLRSLPLKAGSLRPVLEDVASIRRVTAPAQVNRKGPNRYVTIVANVYGKDLGTASHAVKQAIKDAGEPPRGTTVWTEGTLQLLDDTLGSLLAGLGVAIIAIFLMLSAYYQSFKVPLIILSVLPAVIAGSLIILFLTGSTLNLQSYMGIIMSLGVSVSNAVLLVNQAEYYRKKLLLKPANAARLAASSRLRPVIMTAAAMLAGMLPMAMGLGDGAEQVAPLGRAVIGGLIASTVTILLLVPHFFSSLMSRTKVISPSLDPDDYESRYYAEQSGKQTI